MTHRIERGYFADGVVQRGMRRRRAAAVVLGLSGLLPACAALSAWDGFSRESGPSDGPPGRDARGRDTDDDAAEAPTPKVIRFVQASSRSTDDVGDTMDVTMPNPQTAHNLNVVVVGWYSTEETVEVTDLAGNTYEPIGVKLSIPEPDGMSQQMFFAKDIKVPAGLNVVTATFSETADAPDVRVAEYSGLDLVDPLDDATSQAGSGTTVTAGSLTPQLVPALLVGGGTAYGSLLTPSDDFALREQSFEDNTLHDRIVDERRSFTATGTHVEVDGNWVAHLALFH